MTCTRALAFIVSLILIVVPAAVALAEITPEVVLEGLRSPSAVAIQPETGTVFVAETAAGRVIRVVEGEAQGVITGFLSDEVTHPGEATGPVGLAFLSKQRLIVVTGNEKNLRIYETPEPGGDEVTASDPAQQTAPLESEDEGGFHAVAVDSQAVYAALGNEQTGWIARAEVDGDDLKDLAVHIDTQGAVSRGNPVALVLSPRREIVSGEIGSIGEEADSLLTFYNQKSKEVMLSLETGLRDMVAVAYSPQTGRLYAVDFSGAESSQGGLFRLDAVRRDGKQAIKATQILELARPTSLAFNSSGELLITVWGSADAEAPAGQLLKIGEGL